MNASAQSKPASSPLAAVQRTAQDGRHAHRAYRRDRQRLRRGRAALRPVVRRHRRQDGQRRVDRGDHSRRNPAAGAQRRRRQRQPHPHRLAAASPTAATKPTWWSPSTSRCCSAACASGELKPGCIILLESMWRRGPRPRDRRVLHRDPRPSSSAAGYRVYEIPMERECRKIVSDARRGKNMFALGMLCQHLQPRSAAGARADRARPSARRTPRSSRPTSTCSRRAIDWAGEQSRIRLSHPADAQPPSRRSSSTATPRWRSACWLRAWKSARCIRSRRRPRCRII